MATMWLKMALARSGWTASRGGTDGFGLRGGVVGTAGDPAGAEVEEDVARVGLEGIAGGDRGFEGGEGGVGVALRARGVDLAAGLLSGFGSVVALEASSGMAGGGTVARECRRWSQAAAAGNPRGREGSDARAGRGRTARTFLRFLEPSPVSSAFPRFSPTSAMAALGPASALGDSRSAASGGPRPT